MDEDLEKMSVVVSFIEKLLGIIHIKDFRKLLTNSTITAFESSNKNTNVEYNFGDHKPDPAMIDYLKERSIILSEKTVARVEGDIKFELLEGLKANESIDEITKRLEKVFKEGTPRWQLERIARSEVANAQNAGRLSAYKASGIAKYKMWVAAKGARLCALCKRLNGQIQPLDKPFVDPENPENTWMHPIAHPNGRCSMAPLRKLPDDIVEIGGQIYDASRVTKIELPMTLSKSRQKRKAWVVTFANGYAIQCFEDESDADYFISTSNKKDAGWFDFSSKTYRELKPGWRINKKGAKITFKTDGESRKSVKKVELVTSHLEKFSKEGLVRKKVTVNRLGKPPTKEYRWVKPGKEESKPEMVKKSTLHPDNVKEIVSLSDLGMKGGIHDQHTDIVIFKDESKAIYKRMSEDAVFGEVSAYEINKMIGWDVVPETVAGDFGEGQGTGQLIIDNVEGPRTKYAPPEGRTAIEEKHLDDLAKIFAMDMMSGNHDRNSGNVIIKDDKCYAIDNEFFGKRKSTNGSLDVLSGSVRTGEIDKDDVSWIYSSPMFGWLELSEVPDLWNKFNPLVVKHLKDILTKKSEIINYYSNDKYKSMSIDDGDMTMPEVIEVIKDNFKQIEKYIEDNK